MHTLITKQFFAGNGNLCVSSTEGVQLRHTSTARLAQGAGCTATIGLDVVKSRAGGRWERMRDTIHARLESLLRQRLSSTDFFLPIDDVTYLVTMPAASVDDVLTCCLRIVYELHTSLLGSCTLDELRIATATSVTDDLLEITPLIPPRLLQIAQRAEIVEFVAPTETTGGVPRAEQAMAKATTVPRSASVPDPTNLYIPIWDTHKEVIKAYRCVSAGTTAPSPPSPNVQARESLKLSLAVLNKALESLARHLSQGERFIVDIPVRYDMLSSPVARMDFVAACRQQTCDFRPYLIFEIAEMPLGVPHSRVVDLTTALQPFGRAVMAQFPPHNVHQSTCECTGLRSVGFTAPSPLSTDLQWNIDRLVAVARRLGLSTFLSDVAAIDVLGYAVEAGIRWVSGPAVASPMAAPAPMWRLSRDAILRGAVPNFSRSTGS